MNHSSCPISQSSLLSNISIVFAIDTIPSSPRQICHFQALPFQRKKTRKVQKLKCACLTKVLLNQTFVLRFSLRVSPIADDSQLHTFAVLHISDPNFRVPEQHAHPWRCCLSSTQGGKDLSYVQSTCAVRRGFRQGV